MIPPSSSRLPLVLQCCALVTMLAVLALLPPDRGRMLVIALPGAGPALLPRILGTRATLIARGPLPGSYVVDGDIARLRPAIGRALLTAAPRAGCDATA